MDTIHDEGWIKLYRKIINSQVFQSKGLLKVWIWCLLRANHKDSWVPFQTGRGTSQVFIRRGQFIFGRKKAAKELKMPGRTVDYQIAKLNRMRNLATQVATHYSIITILNYELYQGLDNKELPGTLPGICQPIATNNNNKNEKNKIGRSKKQTDPRVKEFMDHWRESFCQKTGQPYVPSFGKEGKLIQQMLTVHSLEKLEEMLEVFFHDEQCKRRGFTVAIFFQEINRLVARKELDPLEEAKRQREARARST